MGGFLPSDPLKQIQAFLIEANEIHLRAAEAELAHHLIESRYTALIPDVG